MNYKVYKIERIDTLEIVYIGITKNKLKTRFNQHFKEFKNNKRKVNYFKKYKNLLKIELIQDNINSLKEANELEIKYITDFKKKGCVLLNATDGGDGTLNLVSWNKGLKCTYKDKLSKNSPNAKEVYSYSIDGFFLKKYSSIKNASEDTKVPRCAIKNICELKKSSKTYKNLTFRYFQKQKVNIYKVSNKDRIALLRKSKINNAKKVCIFVKSEQKEYLFNNYYECMIFFSFKKSTLQTYLSISKETKKYKFNYV